MLRYIDALPLQLMPNPMIYYSQDINLSLSEFDVSAYQWD